MYSETNLIIQSATKYSKHTLPGSKGLLVWDKDFTCMRLFWLR